MKYDLIIIGAGPAGLMAASTAAREGLKVLLLERKKEITSTPRSDVSIFYWKFLLADEYLEPVMVDLGTGVPLQAAGRGTVDVKANFRFLGPGFKVGYEGPLLFYHNYIKLSPSGYRIFCIKDELWGFYFSREKMLKSLYQEVMSTSAEVLTGVIALGAANTNDGVAVKLKAGEREWAVEGRKALAADGMASRIVDSLGLNQGRPGKHVGVVGYILEGVQPEVFEHNAWLSFDIPGISPEVIYCGYHAEADRLNLRHLVGFSAEALRRFMKESHYAPWFHKARLIRTTGFGGTLHSPPLKDPVAGNVLVIGDAVSAESFIQGAIACGYKAAKAVIKELRGEPGFAEYSGWLHRSFAFYANGEHLRAKTYGHIFPLAQPTDKDIDYVFKALSEQGYVGHPGIYLAHHPELVENDCPEFYRRLKKAIDRVDAMIDAGKS